MGEGGGGGGGREGGGEGVGVGEGEREKKLGNLFHTHRGTGESGIREYVQSVTENGASLVA